MTPHADILEQPERLRSAFVGSLVLHVATGALFAGLTLVKQPARIQLGDPNGGGMGAVAINTVKTFRCRRRRVRPTRWPTTPSRRADAAARRKQLL
jgi:hypothetical protein